MQNISPRVFKLFNIFYGYDSILLMKGNIFFVTQYIKIAD